MAARRARVSIKSIIKALTLPGDIIPLKLPLILGAISPLKDAVSVLQRVQIHPLINTPIIPDLLPIPILNIILPLPLIHGPIRVLEDAVAVGLVIHPVPEVHMPLRVDQSPLPIALVVLPKPFVDGAVRPDLLPEAVPEPVLELAFVGLPVLELVRTQVRVLVVFVGEVLLGVFWDALFGVDLLDCVRHLVHLLDCVGYGALRGVSGEGGVLLETVHVGEHVSLVLFGEVEGLVIG